MTTHPFPATKRTSLPSAKNGMSIPLLVSLILSNDEHMAYELVSIDSMFKLVKLEVSHKPNCRSDILLNCVSSAVIP